MTGFVPDPGQSTTGAVSGAIGSALGGMLSEAAIAQASAGVQQLSAAAKSGGFAISEEGANQYIKVFQDFEDTATDLQRTAERASEAPLLGTSPYAATVAQHTSLVAAGDQQSYTTALQSLIEIVRQAREAFEEAKKNYAQMDDEAVQTFSGVQA